MTYLSGALNSLLRKISMLFAIVMFAENAINNMFRNFWMSIVLPAGTTYGFYDFMDGLLTVARLSIKSTYGIECVAAGMDMVILVVVIAKVYSAIKNRKNELANTEIC